MSVDFSIIIPHKDIPKLLQRCLDTIPQCGNIQVIVVDDNSSSAKVDFKHFPGIDRANVEILFTKEGKGAGYARNCGLKYAKGKWVLFADADDFFHPCLEVAINECVDADCDIIFYASNTVDAKTLEILPSRLKLLSQMTQEELRYKWPVPWAKMIKKSFIDRYHIYFDETIAANDVMFSLFTGYYAEKIKVSSFVLYCATVRQDSLWYGMSYDSLLARITVACRFNRFLYKKKIPCAREYSYGFVDRCKVYGCKAYLRGLCLYLCKEHIFYIYEDFSNLIKAKLRKK